MTTPALLYAADLSPEGSEIEWLKGKVFLGFAVQPGHWHELLDDGEPFGDVYSICRGQAPVEEALDSIEAMVDWYIERRRVYRDFTSDAHEVAASFLARARPEVWEYTRGGVRRIPR